MVGQKGTMIAVATLLAVVGTLYAFHGLPNGRYQIASFGGNAWRVDTRTGYVSVCAMPSRLAESPRCSPWGNSIYTIRKQ